MARDFLTGDELSATELAALLDRADRLKSGRPSEGATALVGHSVALLFERPSTRTRVSLEVGVAELGGVPIVLRGDELQLSRGESIADTGRVLSRYVSAIAIRSGSDDAVAALRPVTDHVGGLIAAGIERCAKDLLLVLEPAAP